MCVGFDLSKGNYFQYASTLVNQRLHFDVFLPRAMTNLTAKVPLLVSAPHTLILFLFESKFQVL